MIYIRNIMVRTAKSTRYLGNAGLFLSRAYMIPKDGQNKTEAALLLDFMLSPTGENLLRDCNPFYSEASNPSQLPQSAERGIAIEPTLLVAGDQHRHEQFVDLWRSAFVQKEVLP